MIATTEGHFIIIIQDLSSDLLLSPNDMYEKSKLFMIAKYKEMTKFELQFKSILCHTYKMFVNKPKPRLTA